MATYRRMSLIKFATEQHGHKEKFYHFTKYHIVEQKEKNEINKIANLHNNK